MITERQAEALAWGRQAYGKQLRKRLNTRPETLPIGYRHLYWHPFGRQDWNEYMRILRRMLWQGKLERMESK